MVRGSGGKIIGMAVVALSFFLAAYNSISGTSALISDSNPAAYGIVAMLMIFLVLGFSLKKEMKPDIGRQGIYAGVAVFAVYIAALSYLRGALSFLFWSFRIDALLFPLVLISFILIVFGGKGVRKLKFPIIYSAFASPLLFYPLIKLNDAFVGINASAVYGMMRLAGIAVQKSGILLTAPSSYSISIASTCAALGIFIALLLFLVPMAYLYEGPIARKVAWVAAGMALMFALNIARMLSISLVWIYYGLSTALGIYHLFIGQLLFYAAIIISFLVAGRFGLSIAKVDAGWRKRISKEPGYANPALAIPILLGIAGIIATLPYASAINVPFTSFTLHGQINSLALRSGEVGLLANSRMNVADLGSGYGGEMFALGSPAANGSGQIYVAAYAVGGAHNQIPPINYSGLKPTGAVILRNGITVSSAVADSGGKTFYISYFSVPQPVDGGYLTTVYGFFSLSQPSLCNDTGIIGRTESYIYDALSGQGRGGVMCAAYLAAASTVS
jgi:exosortase/archaeosortase family protein